ncbi:hypothetical protein VTN31DRAFT_4622 [Thermomyces dupontii]|uniref:uncharacterized protein n=1 Tax=Talaromyces thermophilus TaxID=28565 RepID=UPI003744604B
MSLKRKASFPSAVSMGMGTYTDPQARINDVPRHLNSRTRKRFRDDRPNEQTIYENTLRMLFAAQKRPQMPAEEEPESPTSSPSELEEPMDPRQQSLYKYFRPVKAPTSERDAKHSAESTLCQSMLSSFDPPSSIGSDSSRSDPSSGSASPSDWDVPMDDMMDLDSS